MSKVRVYEVAKQLNMDQKTLVSLFQSIGVGDVRNHMSTVEVDAVERLKRHLDRQKSTEVVEERIRPTVVKRRARVAESAPSSPGSSSRAAPAPEPSRSARGVAAAPERAAAEAVSPAPVIAEAVSAAAPSAPASAAKPGAPSASKKGRSSRTDGKPAGTSLKDVDFDEPAAESAAPAPAQVAVEIPPGRTSSAGKGPASSKSSAAKASSAGRSAAEGSPAEQQAPVQAAAVDASAPGKPTPSKSAPDAVASSAGAAVAASAEVVAPAAETPPAAPEASAKGKASPGRSVAAPRGAKLAMPPPALQPTAGATRGRTDSVPPASEPPASDGPKRPSTPPRTGIDVWQGRPGVPMPQARTSVPPARRTTYDPRAQGASHRPGANITFPGHRGGRGRPGYGQNFRGRHSHVPSGPKRIMPQTEMAAHKKIIKIEENVSLQKIAGLMSLKVTDVLMKLLSMGMPGVNINSTIDADTAKILANEFGWTVEDVAISEEESLEAAMGFEDEGDVDFEPRPPIVTVMGHVDHGKTSLLDRIRKTTVASGEAGGITQHIGAYRVETPKGTIAFLDTPGHEAFTQMRARGAQVTDIVILVVAADDGVMPQTREAIAHAQAAKVPIIVAINKIDKPASEPERIRRDLSNLGLQPEEWGGQTLYCEVSAHTGKGIEELLEAVVLQAEVLETSAAPSRRASGIVIEALLDRGRGPVARVMIQDGTLRVGDVLIAGPVWGKVRAMTDELGRPLAEAGPSTPVEVLGLGEVPSAGDPVHAVKDAKTAEEIAETRRSKANKSLIPQDSRVSLEALRERMNEADMLELRLIIKGDVQGSVEAVVSALHKLSSPKVKVTVVHAGVGAITEGDVNLGIAAKAIIIGFNVRPAGKASQTADAGGVEIRLYNIIYNAVDDIKAAMEGLLPTIKLEKDLGSAEVRQVFKITKVGVVAGSYVTKGVVRRNAEARLVRDGTVVHTCKISSLKRIKEDVKEVAEGLECGITLENYQDIKDGDIIEAYEIEEVKQKLD